LRELCDKASQNPKFDKNVWVNDADAIAAKKQAVLFDFPDIGGFGAWEIGHDTDDYELSRALSSQ